MLRKAFSRLGLTNVILLSTRKLYNNPFFVSVILLFTTFLSYFFNVHFPKTLNDIQFKLKPRMFCSLSPLKNVFQKGI
jgi:hypothetical protein